MPTNSRFLKEAADTVRSAKNERDKKYELVLREVYDAVPRLYEIDRRLSEMGAAAAITALSGNLEKIEQFKKESASLSAEKQEILESANVFSPKPNCALCNDTGLINGQYCECVKRIARNMLFKELEKEMPIADQRFENFDLAFYPDTTDGNGVNPRRVMSEILNGAKKYCADFNGDGKSMLFMGGVGLGKTHISLSIAAEIAAKGYHVVYGSAQNLFSRAEKEHFSYSETRERTDELFNADLLVIDDLGTEFLGAFTQSFFYNLINTRILQKKATIINTNLSFREIEERYTARISSRFIGEYKMIKFYGDDIRLQKALKK